MDSKRIHNQPAWLLHHRPYRDSSQLLEILSRDHGRLSLVARGSRSSRSKSKGILRPFAPLRLSWFIRTDLGTLTGAEIDGPAAALAGEALLSGYYMNELLLKLLHRHDPQPDIVEIYANALRRLDDGNGIEAVLREFELELLCRLGYALNLDHDAESGAPLRDEELYEYQVENGPVRVGGRQGAMTFSGATLFAIRERDFARGEVVQSANRLLRRVIAFHLGGAELKSRKVLLELRRTPRIRDNVADDNADGAPY